MGGLNRITPTAECEGHLVASRPLVLLSWDTEPSWENLGVYLSPHQLEPPSQLPFRINIEGANSTCFFLM